METKKTSPKWIEIEYGELRKIRGEQEAATVRAGELAAENKIQRELITEIKQERDAAREHLGKSIVREEQIERELDAERKRTALLREALREIGEVSREWDSYISGELEAITKRALKESEF